MGSLFGSQALGRRLEKSDILSAEGSKAMAWAIPFLLLAVGIGGFGAGVAVAEDKPPSVLEQEYDRETNPRKRAGIAVELTRQRLQRLRAAYDAEDPDQREEAVEAYLASLERLESAVTAASNAGTSKNAETHLRRQGRDLENFKSSVSYFDRPAIEKVIARVAALREQILYSIMNPNRGKAKK